MKIDLKVETLKRWWLLSDVDECQVRQLSCLTRSRRFTKGEVIIRQGDSPDFLYVVSSGMVRLFRTSICGRTFTTYISSSSDELNLAALFGAEEYFLSAEAMSETSVLSITRSDFLAFVQNCSTAKDRILARLGEVLNSTYERLCDLAGEIASQRVLNVLYMLHRRFGSMAGLRREDIARMAGTTIETTVRTIADLKTARVIESRRGGIVVIDEKKLDEICRSSYVIHTGRKLRRSGTGSGLIRQLMREQ
jgi:CRP/FNR family transcriptional regulator